MQFNPTYQSLKLWINASPSSLPASYHLIKSSLEAAPAEMPSALKFCIDGKTDRPPRRRNSKGRSRRVSSDGLMRCVCLCRFIPSSPTYPSFTIHWTSRYRTDDHLNSIVDMIKGSGRGRCRNASIDVPVVANTNPISVRIRRR